MTQLTKSDIKLIKSYLRELNARKLQDIYELETSMKQSSSHFTLFIWNKRQQKLVKLIKKLYNKRNK
jgi:hypothetical protein